MRFKLLRYYSIASAVAVVVATAILVVVYGRYGVLVLIVRRADRVIDRQYENLDGEITERKRAEAALREGEIIRQSEERLRTIFETSPIGIAIVSTETNKRLYINPAMVELFGAESVDQLMKHDLSSTFADPADLDGLRSKTGENFITEAEIERVRLDGTKWWCLLNRQSIKYEGEEALMAWHYDITERKEAEQKKKNQRRFGATSGRAHTGTGQKRRAATWRYR